MHTYTTTLAAAVALVLAAQPGHAEPPSAFGSGFDVQGFFRPFSLQDITPANRLGVSVVFLQDRAVNAELDKFFETRDRALAVIYHLRSKANRSSLRGL